MDEKKIADNIVAKTKNNYDWELIRKLDGEEVKLDGKKYSSIIVSVNSDHIYLTVNYRGDKGLFVKEIIKIDPDDFSIKPILKDCSYSYIDGVDSNFVRVRKDNKWGLIYLNDEEIQYVYINTKNGKPELLDEIKKSDEMIFWFDNLWNFYNKSRTTTRAEAYDYKLDVMIDLSVLGKRKLTDKDINSFNKAVSVYPVSCSEKKITFDIKKITVKGFKKYVGETVFPLDSGITFEVGKNNAGKSTILDAIDVCLKNLKGLTLKDGKLMLDCVYETYHSKNSEDNKMFLSIEIAEWLFSFYLEGTSEIKELKIKSLQENDLEIIVSSIENKIIFKGSGLRIELELDKVIENELVKVIEENGNKIEKSELYSGLDVILEPLMKKTENDENRKEIMSVYSKIDNLAISLQTVERIPIFTPRRYQDDSCESDFILKCICEFKKSIESHDEDYSKKLRTWVSKWLDRMEIGKDFKITEENKVKIIKENNEEYDLYDLGSGSIHFVVLCFKILAFISNNDSSISKTLLIEEPEQNLHPCLQSHLANFFCDIHLFYKKEFEKQNFKMIIETHSEYLIRRSQVIVKKLCGVGFDIEDIPFKTYYFPEDDKEKPYDMKYTASGAFKEKFGHGFTDESYNSALQLF